MLRFLIRRLSLSGRYESRALLRQYVRSQYGPFLPKPDVGSEDFYKTIIAHSVPYLLKGGRALDAGCGTGRLAFEWAAAGARKVVGIDTSRAFIRFCNAVKKEGAEVRYYPARRDRTEFIRGDIMAGDLNGEPFNFVSCVNVLDRVQDPSRLIAALRDRLAIRGMLVLVTPYDWEFSPAPARLRVADMKTLLSENEWKIEKEVKDIPYAMALDNSERTYKCHLVAARRLR